MRPYRAGGKGSKDLKCRPSEDDNNWRGAAGLMLSISKRTTVFLSLAIVGVILDQATKLLAQVVLSSRPVIHFFGDTLRLQLALNSGGIAAIGAESGEGLQTFFLGWNLCMLGAVIGWGLVSKTHGPIATAAAALVSSGGVGNLLDRLLVGGVIDFLTLNVFGFRTLIFNVADLLILSGLATLLVTFGRERKPSTQGDCHKLPSDRTGCPEGP